MNHEPRTKNETSRTILVTGGAGFIGSNFIRYIFRKHPNWTVINLDKLTYAGNLANLTDIEQQYGVSSDHERRTTNHEPRTKNQELGTRNQPPRYYFVKGSITDRELIDSLFTGNYFANQEPRTTNQELNIDIVVNFAAESHVDRSILDASPFIETNIKGTQVLLEAIRTHWGSASASPHRLPTTHHSPVFLQISTDEVYGALGETGKFTEESPLLPNSPYAASKASAEMLCRAYHVAYELPIIVTRSSNNYGSYQFPEKLIPLMIRNALNGKPLPVYGEGKQVRDWLYVEDNCAAIDAVLQSGKPGEVYNIGGNCEKPNIDVVKQICSILDQKLKSSSSLVTRHSSLNELIEFIADPRGAAHDFRYALDSSKISEALGWKPEVAFEEGLKRTVNWYLQNQDWVENVITGEYQEYYRRVYGTE
jgi:dTDP-glucose 4,6-dehydratase